MAHNMVGWFEIPVKDMPRAKGFYEEVFQVTISINEMESVLMGWFPMQEKGSGAGGTLVKHEEYIPSATHGVLIYFSCEDLKNELGRVEKAGGKILQAKTEIGGGYGFMAVILDSEGNRIALHSMK